MERRLECNNSYKDWTAFDIMKTISRTSNYYRQRIKIRRAFDDFEKEIPALREKVVELQNDCGYNSRAGLRLEGRLFAYESIVENRIVERNFANHYQYDCQLGKGPFRGITFHEPFARDLKKIENLKRLRNEINSFE